MKVKALCILVVASVFMVSGLWAQEVAGKALLDIAICPLPPSVSIGENENGKLVKMFQGQDLIVSLPSNPTTGYDWHVRNFTPSILEQTDVSFKPTTASGLVPVGSGGTKVYTFRAMKAGESVLDVVYQRPWAETVPPLKTFSVRVFVNLPPTPPTHGNFSVKSTAHTYRGVVNVTAWKEIANGEEEAPEITAGPQTFTEYTKDTYDRFGSAVFAAHDMAPSVEARAIAKANAMWSGSQGSLRTETKWDFVEVHPEN